IAEKYVSDPTAIDYLSGRIIKGGGGVWGQVAMAAHPQLTKSETDQMVRYILSLAENAPSDNMDLNGTYQLNKHTGNGDEGRYYLIASYSDKGATNAKSITAREVITLRSPTIPSVAYDDINGAMKFEVKAGMAPGIDQDMEIVIANADSWVAYDNIDMTGIKNIELLIGQAGSFFGGGSVEIRADAPDGQLLGSAEVKQGLATFGFNTFQCPIDAPIDGMHKLYVNFKAADAQKPVGALIALVFSNVQKSS
ncbi:MAG: carbohydrate-binding protein, partial [Bacteroidota bacterium]